MLAQLTSSSCTRSRRSWSLGRLIETQPGDDRCRGVTRLPDHLISACHTSITTLLMFSQFFNSSKCDSSCSKPTVARIPPHAQEVLSRAETIDAPKRKQLRFPKCWKLKQQENNGTPVCSFPCHLPLSLSPISHPPLHPPSLVDFFMPHLLYVTSQQGRLPAAGERSWPPTQRPAALILQAGTELSCSPEQRLRKQEDITHLSTPTIYPGGFQNTDKSSQRDSIINLHWGIETRLPWEETQDLIRGKHYKSSLYCYCGVTVKKPCRCSRHQEYERHQGSTVGFLPPAARLNSACSMELLEAQHR